MSTVPNDLLEAIQASDVKKATKLYQEQLNLGIDAWKIHNTLFPIVQRVLNPPYINPHLPKMYRIYRELAKHLEKNDIPSLVNLEICEYARRKKLKILPKNKLLSSHNSLTDIESSIEEQDWEKTTALFNKLYTSGDIRELSRRLLLIGSGYLDDSLGHSVSCTTFILLEIIQREDQDPWPGLATLSDYFCKGQFTTTPKLLTQNVAETRTNDILRAVSGRGFVNLHHTITRYAIERVRTLLTPEEYTHMVNSWIAFMGEKQIESVTPKSSAIKTVDEYGEFYDIFSRLEVEPVIACLASMLDTPIGRQRIGRFLVKGLCDLYPGDYDPHYLTGLGSVLWVINQYWQKRSIAISALHQYLDHFFQHLI
jgi:hypothetical protein